MSLRTSDLEPQPQPVTQSHACAHSRMISDSVSEEEQTDGKVRCLECGAIMPDPHLQRDAKVT